MTEQEMQALQQMMESTMQKELAPIHEKLDNMAFQLDTVYKWVDRIDIDVKKMKKAQ